jgi:hypothetical protein
MRKRWKNAVMSIYGTLVKHAPSRQVPEEILNRREQSRAENLQGAETRISQIATNKPETVTIDRRGLSGQGNAVALPGGRGLPGQGNVANIENQRSRFSQQAAIAARLRSLRGED